MMVELETGTAGQPAQVALALTLLTGLRSGKIDRTRVTADFSWWWNRDQWFSLEAFAELLAGFHAATVDGVTITPKLAIAHEDTVMVEATSHAALKDGRIYANRYVYVIQFKGDFASEVREYCDTAHVAEIFGLGA